MANTFSCRIIEDDDLPAVKAIWREVFRDPQEYIDEFFRLLYAPGNGLAAVSKGEIISHFFSLPGIRLRALGQEYEISYLAALATALKHRGIGAGAHVSAETVTLAFSQGAQFACLMPANDTLYGWYERTIGAKPLFYARERYFSGIIPSAHPQTLKSLSFAEYNTLREKLLASHPHIYFGGRFPDWIEYEFKSGGFFSLGDNCCAAVSCDTGFKINELLCRGSDFSQAVSAIASHFDAIGGTVVSPAFWGYDEMHGKVRPTVIAATRPGIALPNVYGAYWGFAFD